jgi:hypothetical protein
MGARRCSDLDDAPAATRIGRLPLRSPLNRCILRGVGELSSKRAGLADG